MFQKLFLGALLTTLLTSPASAVLRHLYTFNDGTANDTQGTNHGTLVGGATISGGEVMLAGGPINTPDTSANNMGPHVNLNGPGIAVNTYPALSLELWLKSSSVNVGPPANFTMAAVLGRHTLNTGGNEAAFSGHDYLMMQPTRGGGPAAMRIAITNDRFEAETGVNGPAQLADGLLHQWVATVNATTLTTYFDGQLQGSIALGANSIAQMANDVAYLGRSVYSDPFFAGSIDEFRIYNNALTAIEVENRFNLGPVGTGSPAVPRLTIDRGTGTMTLSKQGTPLDMFRYTINSPSGGLDPTKWQTNADNRDADDGGSFDPDDVWTILSATNLSLSEEDPVDGSSDNGGKLGVGAGATPSLPLLTNGGWIRTYREDITMTLDILVGGVPTVTPVTVSFTGNGGQPYKRSDFNFDNLINATDYNTFLANHLKTLTETVASLSYVKGDINGDLRNDVNDFRLFKADYIAANGEAAFAALMASVPEPGSACLLALGVAALAVCRRRMSTKKATTMNLEQTTNRLGVGVGMKAGLAALCTLLVGVAAQAAVTHQYTFNDGTANDSVGTAHGTFVNGPTVTIDGQADLDGANDYISLPGPAIAINTYTAVTLEAWFTIDATPDWQRLYDFGDTNPTNLGRNYIFYSPSSGPADHRAVISDADPGFNSEEVAIGGPELGTGIEHHIAVTISNGGSMTLYRNGVQVGTVALTKSLASVSNNFALLGESTYTGDANLNGRIDEFRIHNVALTPAQVLSSFNTGQNFKSTIVLDVNTITGAVQLRNTTATPLTFDHYQITSASGSLSMAGWNSLSDQNVGTIGPGTGQSWDEAGGLSANLLSELFLLSGSTLAPGGTLALGNAYNTSVAGNDLRLQYSLTDGTVARSAVNYISSVIDADFDNNGIVEGRDFLIWQRNLGLGSGATNAQGDSDANGAVNAADLANWRARFGQPMATASASAIPEPAAWVLALAAALASICGWRMRRPGAIAVR